MIIYKRKKKQLVIPCGLGPVVCPDTGYDLQAKTIDSSTVLQIVEPDSGYYGMYRVTVNPLTDDNLLPGNIKAGVEILGVLGTYAGELIRLQEKTVNPSTSQVIVTADASYDGLSRVVVNAVTADIDPDLIPENIKRGVEILGVEGTFEGGSLGTKTIDSSTVSQTVTPDASDYGLSSVIVNPYTLESKSQTITVNGTYTVTPDNADGLSSVDISVNVADIPAVVQTKSVTYTQNGEYQVEPDEGYDGLSHVDVSVNVPAREVVLQSKSVNSSTVQQSVTYDQGYDGLSNVTVEPYELDSKTVNSSTSSQTITSDKDGLSSVTINPYTLDSKTVNSSTSSQTVVSDADGLSSVTVNPYTLDSKTVDSSTVSQTITSDVDGLSSVTVNPYTLESKSATLTANGQYTYTATNADALSNVTVDVSIKSAPDLQSKTVNSSTAQQTVQADSSYDGLSSVTVNPYTLDSKTVNPSTNSIIVNSSVDGLSSVTVNAVTAAIDPDLIAENIKKDVEILGVTGIFEGGSLGTKTVDSSTVSQTITPDASDYGLSSVTVNPYTLDSKTVDPSTSSITVNSSADGLSSVTVNAVTAAIDPDIVAGNIKNGVNILGVIGTYTGQTFNLQEKTITANTTFPSIITPDSSYDALSRVNIDIEGVDYTCNSRLSDASIQDSSTYDVYAYVNKVTINSIMTDEVTVDASTVSQTITPVRNAISQVTVNAVDASIDSNIVAGNIKDGITILGVTGTFAGGTLGSKTVDSSTVSQTVTPASGDYGLSSVTVNPYTLETATVNASTSSQTITPTNANGLSSVTINAAPLQNRTVDASTVQLDITRSDSAYYGMRHVYINAVTSSIDSNIQAENIKNGVTILGVTGNYAGQSVNNQNKTVDCSTVSQSVTADSGYTGLGTVTVNAAVLQDLSFSPLWRTTSGGQMVFRTDDEEPGIGMNTVTISAPTWENKTLNASTSQITFDPYTSDSIDFLKSVTINAVTSSIDSNITAGNIKSGVTILGVAGTYEPQYDNIYNALLEI